MPGDVVQVLGAGGGDGGEGGDGGGGDGGVGPEEQRLEQSFTQVWYAAGSDGQSFMHADIEPPGQPGDGGAGGDGEAGGGDGGAGGGGELHLVGSGPWTTRPLIFTSETAKLDACKFPSPPQFPGTHPVHWDE